MDDKTPTPERLPSDDLAFLIDTDDESDNQEDDEDEIPA